MKLIANYKEAHVTSLCITILTTLNSHSSCFQTQFASFVNEHFLALLNAFNMSDLHFRNNICTEICQWLQCFKAIDADVLVKLQGVININCFLKLIKLDAMQNIICWTLDLLLYILESNNVLQSV